MLETVRMFLRPLTLDDLDPLAEICADPAVMKYIGKGKPNTREQTEAGLNSALEHWRRNSFGLWAVVFQSDPKMIGFAGLKYLDTTREIEVGYRLARAYWGMGLATEATEASLWYGFEQLHLKRIVAVVQHGNAASQRVLEKAGLRYEKDAVYYSTDVRYYSLDRKNYRPPASLPVLIDRKESII